MRQCKEHEGPAIRNGEMKVPRILRGKGTIAKERKGAESAVVSVMVAKQETNTSKVNQSRHGQIDGKGGKLRRRQERNTERRQ